MGRVKRKSAFTLAQNVQIHIILHMCKVLSGHLRLRYQHMPEDTVSDDTANIYLFVLRFNGPVNPMGHVERGQFT